MWAAPCWTPAAPFRVTEARRLARPLRGQVDNGASGRDHLAIGEWQEKAADIRGHLDDGPPLTGRGCHGA